MIGKFLNVFEYSPDLTLTILSFLATLTKMPKDILEKISKTISICETDSRQCDLRYILCRQALQCFLLRTLKCR